MDARKKTIPDICNGSRILKVPYFQRAYVWEDKQWERFLDDVNTVCETHTPFFMGSVILKQQPTPASSDFGDIRTIIDGQQRLTTLSILLKVLCLKTDSPETFNRRFRLDDGKTLAIQLNRDDAGAYNTIMNLQKPIPVSKLVDEKILSESDSDSKIVLAYQYFLDNLDPSKVKFSLVRDNILFVGIDLDVGEDEQQIFDTVNSLGVPLTTAELLKNFFFEKNNESDYQKYWYNMFEKDDDTKTYWNREITTGRSKRSMIDLFFFSWLQIKTHDNTLSIPEKDKVAFSKVEKLFDSYKRFIERYLSNDKQHVIDEIQTYADVFRKKFDYNITKSELSANPGIERINAIIFALESTTLIPYILYVESNVSSMAEKNEIYAYLESYAMRRLVTKQVSKNYNQLFTDRLISNGVLSKSKLADYLLGQVATSNRIPTDEEVKMAFHDSVLVNKQAIGVLYMIESRIRNQGLYSTQLLGIEQYSLEHIMPKKWKNHWSIQANMSVETRDRQLLTLGNLALLRLPLNLAIRDADWNTKKYGANGKNGLIKYAGGMETLFDCLCSPEWDETTIKRRADNLAEQALKIWTI